MTDIDDARALAADFREHGHGGLAYTIEAAIDEALGIAGQGIFLTHEEAADARAAAVLADAYEARAENTWGEDEDPIRARWRALADRLKSEHA